VLPFLVGLLVTVLVLRRHDPQTIEAKTPGNPLRFATAIQMAFMFQMVLYLMGWASHRFGSQGTLMSAGLLGLTDLDALIYSMVKLGGGVTLVTTAAQALAIGVLSNTIFKLGLALSIGHGSFRRVVSLGLIALGIASLTALFLF